MGTMPNTKWSKMDIRYITFDGFDSKNPKASITVVTRYGDRISVDLSGSEVQAFIKAVDGLGCIADKLAQIKTELTLDGN